jgi:hypothetical protein
VFRFGATELKDPGSARNLLQTFFTDLFRRFSVTLSPAGRRSLLRRSSGNAPGMHAGK